MARIFARKSKIIIIEIPIRLLRNYVSKIHDVVVVINMKSLFKRLDMIFFNANIVYLQPNIVVNRDNFSGNSHLVYRMVLNALMDR